MNTLQDLKQWASKIGKHASTENVCFRENTANEDDEFDSLSFHIYTDKNSYSIVGTIHDNGRTYLGCTASSRKPRAGEDWTRGSDLADGDLSLETWNQILGDIVAYELVRIYKQN